MRVLRPGVLYARACAGCVVQLFIYLVTAAPALTQRTHTRTKHCHSCLLLRRQRPGARAVHCRGARVCVFLQLCVHMRVCSVGVLVDFMCSRVLVCGCSSWQPVAAGSPDEFTHKSYTKHTQRPPQHPLAQPTAHIFTHTMAHNNTHAHTQQELMDCNLSQLIHGPRSTPAGAKPPPLGLQRALEIAADVAAGLFFLHPTIVHRCVCACCVCWGWGRRRVAAGAGDCC